jgi:hypothetical protein
MIHSWILRWQEYSSETGGAAVLDKAEDSRRCSVPVVDQRHPAEVKVAGHLNGRDLTVESIQKRRNRHGPRLWTLLRIRPALLRCRRARRNSPLAELQLWQFTPKAGESRVDARIDTADLNKLLALFQLPKVVASRVNGTVQARWPEWTQRN